MSVSLRLSLYLFGDWSDALLAVDVLVSQKHKLVLLDRSYLPMLQQVFPLVGEYDKYAVLPHTVDTSIILRNLQIPCAAPIAARYDWPIYPDWTAFAHQTSTSAFLSVNPRAFCLNQMGTMKTLSMMWAADFLMEEGVIDKCLIAAPLSTLERVHADTLRMNFLNRRSFGVVHGTRAQRLKVLAQDHDFYIINHDGVETVAAELKQRSDIGLYMIDECAAYRTATTRRWKVMKSLITPPMWVWGFTGAPTPNEPTDAYGQAKLINPATLKLYPSFRSFKSATMIQRSMFVWQAKEDAWQTVLRVLSPAIRYTRDECLDLPESTFTTLEVALTDDQKRAYQALMRTCVAEVNDGQVTALNEANKLMRLMQVVSGVVYDRTGKHQRIDCAPRLSVVLELLEQTPHKTIIFVPFKGNISLLEAAIAAKKFSVATVNGDTPVRERNRIFDAFQHRADPRVLVAHPQCMAHGLTLTEAATIIWWAPTDSNEIYEQAIDRIRRQGQKNRTAIIHLSGTAVERAVYKRLQGKQKMQHVLLEAVAEMRK